MICAKESPEGCGEGTAALLDSCVAPSRLDGEDPRRGTMALIEDERVLRRLASGDLSAVSCGLNFLLGEAEWRLGTGDDAALLDVLAVPSLRSLEFLRGGSVIRALALSPVLLFHALVEARDQKFHSTMIDK